MSERKSYYATVLPIIEGLMRCAAFHSGCQSRLCLIGPTGEEVAEYSPGLPTFDDGKSDPELPESGRYALISVERKDSLRRILNAYYYWGTHGSYLGGTCVVALPPSCSLDLDLADDTDLGKACRASGTPSLIVIAYTMDYWSSILVAPQSELVDDRSLELRGVLSPVRRMTRSERRREWEDALSDEEASEATQLPETPKCKDYWKMSESDYATAFSTYRIEREWHASAFQPELIWQLSPCRHGEKLANEPISLLKIARCDNLSGRGAVGEWPVSIHVRSFDENSTRRLGQEQSYLENAVKVAAGIADRSEDDIFVPLGDLALSKQWTAEIAALPSRAMQAIAEKAGAPLRCLNDICESIELEGTSPPPRNEGIIWLPLTGESFCTPSLEAIAGSAAEPVARLTCRDSLFLFYSLFTTEAREALRCLGVRSYHAPSLPISRLREFRIPWPSPTRRKDLIEGLASALDGIETLQGLCNDLAEHADDLDEITSPPLWDPLRPFQLVTTTARRILNQLSLHMRRPVADLILSETKGRTPIIRTAPCLLAMPRRKQDNAPDAQQRLSCLFDEVDASVRYYVCIHLALLGKLDASRVKSVFRELLKPTGALLMTMGMWVTAARKALGELNTARELIGELPTPYAEFGHRLLRNASPTVAADKLVHARNVYRGHGWTPTELQCAEALSAHGPHIKALRDAVAWIEDYPPFFLESQRRERKGISLTKRVLVGTDPEFARIACPRQTTDHLPDANEREVYLDLNAGDSWLALHPWIIFHAEDGATQESVWLFDGWSKQGAAYKSPFRPAAELRVKSYGEDVAALLAL